MGFFDELKKLTRPYDDEDDEFIDESEPAPSAAPEKKANPFAGFGSGGTQSQEKQSAAPSYSAPRPARREGRVVSLNGGAQNPQMKVVLIKPERFETAAEIADELREKRAIVMNLETTPKDVGRRLIDFVSGAAYALDGKIKKIAANTYIITPYSVDLSGDMLDDFESGGSSLFE